MTIHKEGRWVLSGLMVGLLVLNGLVMIFSANRAFEWTALAVSLVFFGLILQFFRNPRIAITQGEGKILAPADGKIVAIEERKETEYLNERRRQISIFMSPLNVHINRMPASGEITYLKYHPGKYLVAWHPKSSTENEHMTIVVKTPNGISILFRQIAGAMARRIKLYIKEGQRLDQGTEFGFIRFGSRVDVLVPLDARVCVGLGDKTTAGVTVIAELGE